MDGCNLCIHVCPEDVYERADRLTQKGIWLPVPVHIERCNGCMQCMIYCPDFAIVVESDKESKAQRQKVECG